jgi:hypothetical protein
VIQFGGSRWNCQISPPFGDEFSPVVRIDIAVNF